MDRLIRLPFEALPALLVVAAAIQDPGNLGTLIRSAEAFGASGAVSLEGTVNHWNCRFCPSMALPLPESGG